MRGPRAYQVAQERRRRQEQEAARQALAAAAGRASDSVKLIRHSGETRAAVPAELWWRLEAAVRRVQ